MIPIRRANIAEVSGLKLLARDVIRQECSKFYSAAQIDVWVSRFDDLSKWHIWIADQHLITAEYNGSIAGFASLANNENVFLMYVRGDLLRRGIATALLNELESYARAQHASLLTTEASFAAVAFFEKHGFERINQQEKVIDGIIIGNVAMKKSLS